MTSSRSKNDHLSRIEIQVGALLSVAAVALHCLAGISGGGLWRDEASTIGLSTLPSFSEIWPNLQHDSFPIGWILFVRLLAFSAGPMNDSAFRMAGVLIGLTVLIMLWINARVFKYGTPLISLALVALNPSVIRWGDSLRAYGAGMALAIIIGILIWRFLEKATTRRFVLAAMSAILGVHVLYYNAPVVFAFCVAGAYITIRRRDYRLTVKVIAIGALAAISLLIYVPVIRAVAEWNSLLTVPAYDFWWFAFKLNEAISPSGGFTTAAWLFVTLSAVWLGTRQIILKPVALRDDDRSTIGFAIAALVAIAISQYAFLKTLSYLTQPWYYLTLLVGVGVTVDIIFGILSVSRRMRIVRIVLSTAIGAMSILPATRYASKRMTNVDIVARAITREAKSGDIVLIDPWYLGISFSRYYNGGIPLMTVPEVPFHGYHRYDVVAAEMQKSDQTQTVSRIIGGLRSTLRGGRTVFLVSGRRVWMDESPATLLPAAEIPRDGWKSPLYQSEWSALIGSELQNHAVTISPRILNSRLGVGEYESLYLSAVRGWHE